MTACVYVTDPNWISVLRNHPEQELVNFWRKDQRNFGLPRGSLFYFKIRGTRFVAGRGIFREQRTMSIEDAWNEFGYGNGAESLREFRERAEGVLDLERGKNVNCLLLDGIELLNNDEYLFISRTDFPDSIIAQKFFPDGSLEFRSTISNAAYKDQKTIADDLSLSATQRDQLIKSRVGQGKFRDDLVLEWDNMCAVTGCSVTAALRASHIKPWKDSSNFERLDAQNGLLLIATLDAMFDKHLISFADNGEIIFSATITQPQLESLGPYGPLRVLPAERRGTYLETHRSHFQRMERLRRAML